MIRILRLAISIMFALCLFIFAIVFYTDVIRADKTIPTISIDNDILNVKIDVGTEDLLKGVTAYDEKDGDITDKIVVESISKFIEKGTCTVTYAVCDNDHHVTNAQRKIKYTDYSSPKFVLNDSLCFSLNKYGDVTEIIGAKDVIDGDISKNVIITSDNFKSDVEGKYTISARASNSKGEIITMEFPVFVDNISPTAPTIKLSKYIIYVKKGSNVDYSKYILNVKNSNDEIIQLPVSINSEVNINKPGVYAVHYYSTDAMGRKGHTILNVVVTEK